MAVIDIPGHGEFDLGDMTAADIEKDMAAILKGAPSKDAIKKRLEGIIRARTTTPSSISSAIAAAGDPGPGGTNAVYTPKGDVIDAEGNVIKPSRATQTVDSEGVSRFSSPDPYEPSGPLYGAQHRDLRPRAEDFLTRAADSLSFGVLPKVSAKLGEWWNDGKTGTYDEILAKRRREVEEAGDRLGTAGTIAADLTGGAFTGSAAARIPALVRSNAPGLTLLGRLGPRSGIVAKTGAGAIEGGVYGAAGAAGHTDSDKIEDYATAAARGFKEGGLVGGALGLGGGLLGRLITPFPAESARRTDLANTLRQEGVPVSAGQATGSEALTRAESQLTKIPGGQLLVESPVANDMERVTQQAMQRAGIGGADRATPEVINEGFNRIGGTIGRIQGSTPVHLDNQTLTEAVDILARSQNSLTQPGEIAIVNRFVARLTPNGQQLSPEAASALRTDLNEAIKSSRANPGLRDYLIDVREALDGSLERTLRNAGRDAEHAELIEARRHYANLNVLSDAVARSGSAGDRGVVTPAALANSVSDSVGRTGAVRGRGDLNDLGKAVRGLKVGPSDSGTAANITANWGAMEPARILAGAAVAPFVFNPVTQRYLANQVLPAGVPASLLQGATTGAAATTAGPGPTMAPSTGPADRIMEDILRRQ